MFHCLWDQIHSHLLNCAFPEEAMGFTQSAVLPLVHPGKYKFNHPLFPPNATLNTAPEVSWPHVCAMTGWDGLFYCWRHKVRWDVPGPKYRLHMLAMICSLRGGGCGKVCRRVRENKRDDEDYSLVKILKTKLNRATKLVGFTYLLWTCRPSTKKIFLI